MAASFALLAYVSAWIKHYEPAAFLAALLNSQPMGFYAPAQIVRDARDMADKTYDVVGIGNAIVDIIARCDEGFLSKHDLAKGFMRLIDAEDANRLYEAMGPAVERSGGVVRGSDRKFAAGGMLPEIAHIERAGSEPDGFPLVRPVFWSGEGEI